MKTIELDMYQATAVAALVLLLGRVLVAKISILRRYCIPAPVVGGFLYAIVHTIVRGMGILEISCDMTLKNVFMVAFFCSVGFTASFRMLKKGGVQTVVFLALSAVMVILQNILGAGLASVFGLDPRLGLATGSIPMVGGHGTAGSFGPLLEELGVANASVVAIASATYGLVAGCVIGGPIATAKIRKYKLSAVTEAATKTETVETDETGAIDSARILDGLLYLIVAIGAGTIVSMFLGKFMTFPFYIGAMLVGAIIRNIMDVQNKEIPMEEISTLGGASLSVFLGLAMIDMKLWQLAELAVPMVVMLLAQTVLMFFYANFVVFNVLGKSYDAAVMTSGFCGFGMGATPNAMANMQAITGVYGPAPTANDLAVQTDHEIAADGNSVTAYTLDLLGCGRSEKPNLTYTNYLFVQLICDFIKSEIGHRTNILSTGDSAALSIMACSNSPELFDQIMLINPSSLTDCCQLPGKNAKLYKLLLDLPLAGTLIYHIACSRSMIEEAFRTKYFYNPYTVKPVQIDRSHEAAHLGECPKAIFSSIECRYTKCNISNALRKIDNSIFIIGGSEEPMIEATIQDYKIYNSAIESSIIPKTKHLPQLEQPDAVMDAIHMFFS